MLRSALPFLLFALALAGSAGGLPLRSIPEIQGAGHRSPFEGTTVTTQGVVTSVRSFGFYLQDPAGDFDPATSDALFVFTATPPSVAVGDAIEVRGGVVEFVPGGAGSQNLSITEIARPESLQWLSGGNPLPAATPMAPPTQIIDDDALAVFDPESDGIDYFESLEGMRVTLPGAVAVGPANRFGEIFAVGEGGAHATGLDARGRLAVSPGDWNPERVQIDAGPGVALPEVSTGDHLGDVRGVLDYRFGSFELLATEPLSVTPAAHSPARSSLQRAPDALLVATYNVKNLSARDPTSRFDALATQLVHALHGPDLIALQEVQDASGPANDGTTDAGPTYERLIAAVAAQGGPHYRYVDVPPLDGTSGGQPGGNIRVGYLYDPTRLSLSTTATAIAPEHPAFVRSRAPLLAEFHFGRHRFAVVNAHLTSRSGSDPLFGSTQPPEIGGAARRHSQASVIADAVATLLGEEPDLPILLLGDLNALAFEAALEPLLGSEIPLVDFASALLPPAERSSFVFDGNAQLLDHILGTAGFLDGALAEVEIVHLNTNAPGAPSDHDPVIARLRFPEAVPEPGSAGLVGAGLAWLVHRRRHTHSRANTGPSLGP